MKKLTALIFSVIMILSLSACGEEQNTDVTESTVASDIEVVSEIIESTTNEIESLVEDESSTETESIVTEANTEWKQFLKDYEAWVDDYIELLQKYNENPTDLTILSDYNQMLSQVEEWTEKADEISLEIADDSEAALEYAAEVLRIAEKLNEAIS